MRWWLRPVWVVGHLLAVAAVVGFVVAGFWQLDRHGQRVERNRLVEANVDAPLLGAGDLDGVDPGPDQYRRVRVEGTFVDGQVAIRNRASAGGVNGVFAVTPLRLADGRTIYVNRGWVPPGRVVDGELTATEPPAGRVEVTGWVRPSQHRARFQASEPADGVLGVLNRVDVVRLARQTDSEVLPFYLDQELPASDDPARVEPAELGAGPHLSYAVQWFLFAAVVAVGYPLILRRRARSGGERSDPPDCLDHPVDDLVEQPA